jgi:hypothetical protein
MQIKTTLRLRLTSVRWAVIKKTTNTDKDVRKKELSYTIGENVSYYDHYGNLHDSSSKN